MGKIVKWELNGELDNMVDAIALVAEPAIEVQWRAFGQEKYSRKEMFNKVLAKAESDKDFAKQTIQYLEQETKYTFEVPKERFQELEGNQIVFAPAMIADKLILRVDEQGEPFYGFFDAVAIENAAYAFQKNKLTDKFNINHDGQVVDGVYLAENWLVLDTELDKSQYFGYALPKGSWMTAVKFDNIELYEQYVTSGELTGLSVEAMVIESIILNQQ